MSGVALKRNPRFARLDSTRLERTSAKRCTSIVSAATLVACLILSACGAVRPTKYYRLDIAPGSSLSGSSPFPVTLILGQISAPELFRDDRLVYGTSSVQMGTYDNQRWAEAPTEMLENMLLASLRASGQYRTVEHISSNARGDYVLRGHLSAFEELDSPQVAARFALELELFDRKSGTVVWTQSYAHDEPAGAKNVTAVVEALQTNVRSGLQQLTSSLNQYFASQAAH
ncbi:MAG: ABC-type transport auxiliary lipoprotein family protein [Candidatus Acidiferrales bacterium]